MQICKCRPESVDAMWQRRRQSSQATNMGMGIREDREEEVFVTEMWTWTFGKNDDDEWSRNCTCIFICIRQRNLRIAVHSLAAVAVHAVASSSSGSNKRTHRTHARRTTQMSKSTVSFPLQKKHCQHNRERCRSPCYSLPLLHVGYSP